MDDLLDVTPRLRGKLLNSYIIQYAVVKCLRDRNLVRDWQILSVLMHKIWAHIAYASPLSHQPR